MTPERFKDVERLYAEFLKVVPAERERFLNESCRDDFELRAELESLLSFEDSIDSRIDSVPDSLVAEVFSKTDTVEFVGKKLNQYEILSLLGKGGMGAVYLAKDTKLERKVAIKVLSSDFALETNKISRFLLEAKSASALNHQNILTVHEIGEIDGTNFIVTEFIEGRTLKQYINEEKPSLQAILEIALQIVSALSAAHEAGIVHRDIKPDNIMVRKEGFVKVLDFGLAKLSDKNNSGEIDLDAATKMKEMTAQGLIIGTPQYMSPEQARGQKIDLRTDIFSFGIVLYEMIAGKPPFSGVNEIDTIGSILKDEPKPLREQLPEVSDELERVVSKSLRKDRDKRYQHIKDLYIDLNDLRKSTEPDIKVNHNTNFIAAAKTLDTSTSIVTQRRFSLIHAVSFILIAAVGFGTFWWLKGFGNSVTLSGSPPKIAEVVNWASSPGETEIIGSFSPDGKMVAYTSTQSGTKNVWIKQTATGDAFQVTKDEFLNRNPIWSPSGQELAFYSTRGNQSGIWRIPILGGSPTLIAELDNASVRLKFWSKNNVIYLESKKELFALDTTSGQIKQITDHKSQTISATSINISPDERKIVYTSVEDEIWNVWTAELAGGNPTKLFESSLEIKNVFWDADGQNVLFSSIVDGTFQIFIANKASAQPKQVTFGDRDSFVVDVSTDGNEALIGSAKEDSDIWAFRLTEAKEFTLVSDINTELWANVSPDGKSIAYQSVKNPSQGNKLFYGAIFTKGLESEKPPLQLAPDGFLPVWAPDGQNVAFMHVVGEKYQLDVVNAAGGMAKPLIVDGINTVGYTVLPYNRTQTNDFSWSPDGAGIAYVSDKNGFDNIWLVRLDGTGLQLTDNRDTNTTLSCPIWSSDGKQIAYSSKTPGADRKSTYRVSILDTQTKLTRVMTENKAFYRLIGWTKENELLIASTEESSIAALPIEISLIIMETPTGSTRVLTKQKDAYLYNIQLSKDAKTIAFAARREGEDNIWIIPVSGGEAIEATKNKDPKLYFSSLAWSPDNNTIFFGKQTRYSLLSMLTNFK